MMTKISFYLDENIDHDVARGLRTRAIDVLTTSEAGNRGFTDREHLSFALEAKRVIVTSDEDFLILHSQGVEHAGIVYFKQQSRTIKQILRGLFIVHTELNTEDMTNRVEYL